MKGKIIGRNILTPIRLIEGEIAFEDGYISYVGERDKSTDGACRIYDAENATVTPGFIDLHVHGGGGHDFMDGDPAAFHGAAHMHALHGTTTLLPTCSACGEGDMMEFLQAYHAARNWRMQTMSADMPGVHMEGPYFSPAQAGAQNPDCIVPPRPEQYTKLVEMGKGHILRWSAAPELPGAMEFGRYLRKMGIQASIGHSNAEESVVAEAIENGFSHITHLYSGTSTIIRKLGYRFPGIVESAYLYPELTSEVIADGHHLPASLLQLAYRSIGVRRLALITDALRGAGMPEGMSEMGSIKDPRPCLIEGGVAKLTDRSAFAGSVTTTDRLVGNMVRLAGASLTDAVKMATITPARIMGWKDRGMLSVGMRADIVLLDEDFRTVKTFVQGKEILQ